MYRESEFVLENNFIDKLMELGYESIVINDSDELLLNFRTQLNKINFDKLDGVDLSDDEFFEVKRFISKYMNPTQCAKMLKDESIVFSRDGVSKHLRLFNTDSYDKNVFQVTNQISQVGKLGFKNRYDVTILVNGLPLVQVELKARDVSVDEALNQIKRYKKHTMDESLFRFTQVFVISNGNNTRYFANNSVIDKKFVYNWTDEKNVIHGDLFEFANSFLDCSMLFDVVSKYMIIQEVDKVLMIMRPYQIYATKLAINLVYDDIGHGYVWHTTGSGKTLTSFKLTDILSRSGDFDKIFFIVDRKDLDAQTTGEYSKFGYKNFTATDSTKNLVDKIEDSSVKVIVTTINKLDRAIASNKLKGAFKDLNVILMFDECHRSQIGGMHKRIDEFFIKNKKVGFTGTPILKDNAVKYQTTSEIFNEQIHSYLINNAISDGNVLGFDIDYKSVIKGVKDGVEDFDVEAIDTNGVYKSKEYVAAVCNDIISIHDIKTKNRKFNAILATSGIDNVVLYYNQLTKLNNELNLGLKISAIFSAIDNEDKEFDEERSMESMRRIMDDYSDLFGTKYDDVGVFRVDLEQRIKDNGLDIVIVSDMFLTGFDAKYLNTMYLDKSLKYHNLIQAISRTNRICCPTKDVGNIISYRTSKFNVDEAIKLFSDKNAKPNVLKKSYDLLVNETNNFIEENNINDITPDIVINLIPDEQVKFVSMFKQLLRYRSQLSSYRENDTSDINIEDDLYNNLLGTYKTLLSTAKKDKESVLNDIDFEVELIGTYKIDLNYILSLLGKLEDESIDKIIDSKKRILDIVKQSQIPQSKIELLEEFIKNYKEGNIIVQYEDYIEYISNSYIEDLIKTEDLDPVTFKDVLSEYEFSGKLSDLDKCFNNVSLLEKEDKKNKVKNKIVEYYEMMGE